MATVDKLTTWAVANTLQVKLRNGKTEETLFRELGVTYKQWRRYISGGRLKVRPAVKAKFELIARFQPEGSDMSLLPVLLKVLEARNA